MSVRFKLADGSYVALSWDLRERASPKPECPLTMAGAP
jgi:hypothetical protein